jgi:hypothetical protein
MATSFPPRSGPEQGAALHGHAETRPSSKKPSAPRRTRRLAPLVAASILLIAVGAVLVWVAGGAVAGVSSDAIGAAAIVLGAIGLLVRMAPSRRSR